MGLHCCRIILSCSFVPIFPCIEARFGWRVMSTSVDASRMLLPGGEVVGGRILARVYG
jgi:hypothetical protein